MLNRLRDVFESLQRHDVRYVVGLPDLLASKLAAGRPKDIENARVLQANTPPDDAAGKVV